MTMDIKDSELKAALLTIIFKSLEEIDDIDTISNYEFNVGLCPGHNIKGSVKVEFEEVE